MAYNINGLTDWYLTQLAQVYIMSYPCREVGSIVTGIILSPLPRCLTNCELALSASCSKPEAFN